MFGNTLFVTYTWSRNMFGNVDSNMESMPRVQSKL